MGDAGVTSTVGVCADRLGSGAVCANYDNRRSAKCVSLVALLLALE